MSFLVSMGIFLLVSLAFFFFYASLWELLRFLCSHLSLSTTKVVLVCAISWKYSPLSWKLNEITLIIWQETHMEQKESVFASYNSIETYFPYYIKFTAAKLVFLCFCLLYWPSSRSCCLFMSYLGENKEKLGNTNDNPVLPSTLFDTFYLWFLVCRINK